MDLLTTYTHHSELQAITALSLISTIHKSPQHPLSFPPCCAFTRRSLVTASNIGDSSASRVQVLSSQPPAQDWTLDWQLTTTGSCLSQCQLKLRLTVSQYVLMSSPIWGSWPDTYWLLRPCLLWGALSDDRTGLSFVCAADLCQRSLSRVRFPITVSDLRLYFSLSPTTRRVMPPRWYAYIQGVPRGMCQTSGGRSLC
jgi:hypothetical protein